jgi:glucosamine--fructose-6-phosphate aminotransferase (isomerizing)
MLLPGIGIDGDSPESPIILFKEVGKVAALRKHIADGLATPLPSVAAANEDGQSKKVDMTKVFLSQTSMAHTRWATHGVPSPLNCHPHVSDPISEFSLVHSEFICPVIWTCADVFCRRYHNQL